MLAGITSLRVSITLAALLLMVLELHHPKYLFFRSRRVSLAVHSVLFLVSAYCSLRYQYWISPNVHVAGFPIPIVYHIREGNAWHDLVPAPPWGLGIMVGNALALFPFLALVFVLARAAIGMLSTLNHRSGKN